MPRVLEIMYSKNEGWFDANVNNSVLWYYVLGALEYELKELLKYVIVEMQLISCDELNNIIDGFPYGYTDSKNKASNISQKTLLSSDHSLKQNGKFLFVYVSNTFIFSYSNMVSCTITAFNDWRAYSTKQC